MIPVVISYDKNATTAINLTTQQIKFRLRIFLINKRAKHKCFVLHTYLDKFRNSVSKLRDVIAKNASRIIVNPTLYKVKNMNLKNINEKKLVQLIKKKLQPLFSFNKANVISYGHIFCLAKFWMNSENLISHDYRYHNQILPNQGTF